MSSSTYIKNKTGIEMSVPSTKEVSGTKEELFLSHIDYTIIVKTTLRAFKKPKHSDAEAIQFSVQRRYTQFVEFQEKIRREYFDANFPPPPPKTLFSSGEDVEERKRIFDKLMREVAAHPRASSCNTLLIFLGIPVRDAKETALTASLAQQQQQQKLAQQPGGGKGVSTGRDDNDDDDDDAPFGKDLQSAPSLSASASKSSSAAAAKPTPSPQKPAASSKTTAANLFAQYDDPLSGGTPAAAAPAPTKPAAAANDDGLTEISLDDNDSIIAQPGSRGGTTTAARTGSVFLQALKSDGELAGDEGHAEDLFVPAPTSAASESVESAESALFGSRKAAATVEKPEDNSALLTIEDDLEARLEAAAGAKKKAAAPKPAVSAATKPSPAAKKPVAPVSLDDDDDDLFSMVAKPKPGAAPAGGLDSIADYIAKSKSSANEKLDLF